jgi:hypothetical protein
MLLGRGGDRVRVRVARCDSAALHCDGWSRDGDSRGEATGFEGTLFSVDRIMTQLAKVLQEKRDQISDDSPTGEVTTNWCRTMVKSTQYQSVILVKWIDHCAGRFNWIKGAIIQS